MLSNVNGESIETFVTNCLSPPCATTGRVLDADPAMSAQETSGATLMAEHAVVRGSIIRKRNAAAYQAERLNQRCLGPKRSTGRVASFCPIPEQVSLDRREEAAKMNKLARQYMLEHGGDCRREDVTPTLFMGWLCERGVHVVRRDAVAFLQKWRRQDRVAQEKAAELRIEQQVFSQIN